MIYADQTFSTAAYDALGRMTSKTDQAGKTTGFGYDALERLTSVTQDVGGLNLLTGYGYDELGNRRSQTDAKFALEVHPEKTRLIEFGRFAAERRAKRGERKPETFDFLGFTHICGTKRNGGGFQLRRKTKRKRRQAFLNEIAAEQRRRRHTSIDEQGRWLATVLRGHYAYFAVPTNLPSVRVLRHQVKVRWYLNLQRRSQRRRLKWRRMNVIANKYLPMPSVLHPWPEQRFLVKHPR